VQLSYAVVSCVCMTDEEGILAGNFFGHFNAADNAKNPMKHTEIFVGILEVRDTAATSAGQDDQADKNSRAR